jgi:hypothetical protein
VQGGWRRRCLDKLLLIFCLLVAVTGSKVLAFSDSMECMRKMWKVYCLLWLFVLVTLTWMFWSGGEDGARRYRTGFMR